MLICRLAAVICLVVIPGCAKKESSPPGGSAAVAGRHEHHAPHGGTAVVLGDDAYHLELVRDGSRLTAYILDGELENFVRVKSPSFELTAQVAGHAAALTFRAVANQATGETAGDTAQFEAEADWLAATPSFDATLTSLEIRGTKFENVRFNFPRGNER